MSLLFAFSVFNFISLIIHTILLYGLFLDCSQSANTCVYVFRLSLGWSVALCSVPFIEDHLQGACFPTRSSPIDHLAFVCQVL